MICIIMSAGAACVASSIVAMIAMMTGIIWPRTERIAEPVHFYALTFAALCGLVVLGTAATLWLVLQP